MKRNLVLRLNLHQHRNIKNKCCNFRRWRRWTACKNGKQGEKIITMQQKTKIENLWSSLIDFLSKSVKISKNVVKRWRKMKLRDIIECVRKCSLKLQWCRNARTFWQIRLFRTDKVSCQESSIRQEMSTFEELRLSKSFRIVKLKLLTASWARWKIH